MTTRVGPSGAGGDETDATTDPAADRGEPPVGRRTRRWTSARIALLVFVAYLVVAFIVLVRIGSFRWFLGDDWNFLSVRSARDLGDLFRPYVGHWVTLPLISYRAIYTLFGIRSYVPYQLPVIVLHLGICVLLRVIMRRSGIGPWMATIAASTFVLFGPGQDDIVSAFQISFNLAVVFGLAQLILSDHPGRIDRRDWLGLAAGALALMSSGEAPGVIVAVGVALLLKRGWKQAAFHTVPLGIMFVVWYTAAGASLESQTGPEGYAAIPKPHLGDYVRWLKNAFQGLIESLAHFGVLQVLLVAILVGGWVLAWLTMDWRTFRNRAALPLGLAIGLIATNVATVSQRWGVVGDDGARSTRYLGIAVGLSLPAFAFAADTITKRWRWTTPAVFAVFLIPIPWNIAAFTPADNPYGRPFFDLVKSYVAAVPASPLIHQLPRWVQPDPSYVGEPGMTVGWLLDAQAEGKLPDPVTLPPTRASQLPVRLGVSIIDGPKPQGLDCRTYDKPITLKPKVDDVWTYDGGISVALAKDGVRRSFPVGYYGNLSNPVIKIALPDLELFVESPTAGQPFTLCTSAPA